MFDISWTEFLLIGVVALIVIGPKELPGVMRTMGQWTRKVRGMAADFQSQFHEAMREAEMTDLKKQVDDMAHDMKDLNPLKSVRDDIEGLGKDFETSINPPEQSAALPPAEPSAPELSAPELSAPELPAPEARPALPEPSPHAAASTETSAAAAEAEAATAAKAAEKLAQPEGAGRAE